jgi:hypothetical protein
MLPQTLYMVMEHFYVSSWVEKKGAETRKSAPEPAG